MIQRWVVGQQEIFVHWEVEDGANVGHDLGLLDRVNAQLALEVLSSSMKSSGYPVCLTTTSTKRAAMLPSSPDGAAGAGQVQERAGSGAGDAAGAGLVQMQALEGGSAASARHPLDVTHHMVERRVVREQEVLVHGSEKRARMSAMISACLTVSMPSSPSRSWSISMKSAG